LSSQEPTCTRKLEFDAGHRLINHGGKCEHYHGHRYVVELTCCVAEDGSLDGIGRVVDFSVIKELFGSWIDLNLDHGMILHEDDDLADAFLERSMKVFIMECNPTAENMVKLLFSTASDLFSKDNTGVEIKSVRLYETPNCWADYPVS